MLTLSKLASLMLPLAVSVEAIRLEGTAPSKYARGYDVWRPASHGPVQPRSFLSLLTTQQRFNGFSATAISNSSFSLQASRPLVQFAYCSVELIGSQPGQYIRWGINYQNAPYLDDLHGFQISPGAVSSLPIGAAVLDDNGYLGNAFEIFEVATSGTCS